MTTQMAPLNRDEKRGKPWLEITLLSGFIVFLLVGLLALAAFFFLYRGTAQSSLSADPLQSFDSSQIAPELALKHLSGDPASALAFQALNAGELGTAHALTLFDTSISGSQRSALLRQLARAYANANEPEMAVQVYRLDQALALLDPTIPPLERGQMMPQIAAGLQAAGETEAAFDSAYQALNMASQLPDLVPAQRAELFTTLLPVAKAVGDEQLLRTVAELADNPFLTPAGTLPAPRLPMLSQPVAIDEPLLSAQALRNQAALQLSDRIQFTGGEDIEPERLALEAALRAEDQARNDFLSRMLGAGLSAGQQLSLLQQHREWIALKARVALLGYGISIVPDWEANRSFILQDLSTVTSNIDVALDTLSRAQATADEQAYVQAEGLQWLALQSEIGLYPQAPVSDLSQRLIAAQNTLAGLGQPLALPVQLSPESSPPGFRLQPLQR